MKIGIRSIKHHTLLLLTGLTLGLALVFSSLAVITAFIVEDMLLENLLEQQAHNVEQYYEKYGDLPTKNLDFIQLFTNASALPDWMNKSIEPNDFSGEIFTPDATHYHYIKLQLGDQPGYLLAEVSGLLVVSHQPGIFNVFIFLLLLMIIVAIWLAFRFSKKIVDPVLSLTDAVITHTTSNNNTRLPQLPYELGYLSNRLQESFDHKHELLEAEKAFATNVSHELRTPLTLVKNAVQLIDQRGFTSNDLIIIKNASEQMEQTVSVLLALARSESRSLQSCNLKSALEDAVLRCHDLLEKFNLQLHLPDKLYANANPFLLDVLFINLLRNAAEHASKPWLLITEKNGQIIFENKTNNHLNMDFTHAGIKSESSSGVGQGLYLVATIAEHFYWQLTIETTDQTFRVLIRFQ